MSFQDGVNKALGNGTTETEIGIGGFRLFARLRESTSYSSVIPDDVLEDGSPVSDDIIRNRITVSIEGAVGDVVVNQSLFPSIETKDYSSVGEITALIPGRSNQQEQAINEINNKVRDAILLANRAERIGGQVIELFDSSSSSAKNIQDQFQEFMEAIYYSGQPIDLSTKRRNYSNMGLADLVINDDNSSGELTFTARFSQIEFAELIYTEVVNYSSPSKSTRGKTSAATNQGGQNPEENTESSLLTAIVG